MMHCSFVLLSACLAMASAGMVGGWSPMAPNGESVEKNANFAAQQINMRVNSYQHKKLINVHSAEAQVVAGIKYRIVFDIATTTCRKNSNEIPANCNDFNKDIVSQALSRAVLTLMTAQPIERCTAVIWERAWLNERELQDFSCDRYMSHEEYFSADNQAREREFKEKAIAAANSL